ncbi:MAG: hypothetical protein L0G49_08460 [Luteococcus sp.]|nr:hypothetical protein [Luteococcus sp.]
MQRRAFVGGSVAAVGAFAVGNWMASSSNALVFKASDTGSFPLVRFQVDKGRWPVRPVSEPVVWIDESGSAPKPPVKKGDAYLRASLAMTMQGPDGNLRTAGSPARGELLTPNMSVLGEPWEARDGAVLLEGGGARIASAGQAVSLGNIPVVAGQQVTYTVDCAEGDVVATLQFWHRQDNIKNQASEGRGKVQVVSDVPAGATLANLWLEFRKSPATIKSASLVQVAK